MDADKNFPVSMHIIETAKIAEYAALLARNPSQLTAFFEILAQEFAEAKGPVDQPQSMRVFIWRHVKLNRVIVSVATHFKASIDEMAKSYRLDELEIVTGISASKVAIVEVSPCIQPQREDAYVKKS